MARQSLKLVEGLFSILIVTCYASKHSFITKNDPRFLIGPIGHPFGFLKGGVYNLTVFDYKMSSEDRKDIEDLQAGFLLKRYTTETSFSKERNEILEGDGKQCIFNNFIDRLAGDEETLTPKEGNKDDEFEAIDSGITNKGKDGIFLSMTNKDKTWIPNTPSVSHQFTVGEEGLYFLIYQVCVLANDKNENEGEDESRDVRSSFQLDVSHLNYDSFGSASYLTAGEIPLPRMYFYFSFSYFLLFMMWVASIRNITAGEYGMKTTKASSQKSNVQGVGNPTVHNIHYIMAMLLGLKAITIFSESVRYHYIRIHGHAEIWSFIYHFFAFLKGIFLFTVIMLIGSGWSFVKSFLNEREKKVIFLVLILQVIDNIAVIILSNETEGERLYDDWTAVLHLVDIVCCCAVLFPIVWQINRMEQQIDKEMENDNDIDETDENNEPSPEDARIIEKLKLFRFFYLLVIGYIYFTRIVVFILATRLGYKQTYLRYLFTELVTLSFYLMVGIKLRPMVENKYSAIKNPSEDEKQENENNLSTLELGTVQSS